MKKSIKNEYELMEELFLAIYFSDVEKVIKIKNQHPEIYSKLGRFEIDNNTTFDLVNLTFFNQTIWEDNTWIEEIMPLVNKYRARTKSMLEFWRSEFGIRNLKLEMEYNEYCEYFYCNYYSDSYEEWKEYELEHINIAYREIDLQLMYHVERFNFPEVKDLLKKGAKSNIDFYDDDFSSADDRISGECSYLTSTFIIPEFKAFEKIGYNQIFNIKDLFRGLLGLAAHEEMYHTLMKFKKIQKYYAQWYQE